MIQRTKTITATRTTATKAAPATAIAAMAPPTTSENTVKEGERGDGSSLSASLRTPGRETKPASPRTPGCEAREEQYIIGRTTYWIVHYQWELWLGW